MLVGQRPRGVFVGCLVVLALGWLATSGSQAQPTAKLAFRDHPLIPPFERFYTVPGADAVKAGRLLLGELNCLSCHRDNRSESALPPKAAPILDTVGSRIKRSYLRQFLRDPHKTKPGTTMPHLLAEVPEAEREQKVEALVHFLASTGTLKQDRPDRKLITAGRELYHKVGCVACHATRDSAGNLDKVLPTSVPIAKTKFSLASLAAFLENPHQVRPSGRMPALLLTTEEAKKIANYLLQGTTPVVLADNMTYAYYEGNWDKLPDFAKLKPLSTGKTSDFDLSVARRNNDMAVKFEGFLKIDREGQYRFHLTSDDGSKLFIDGLEIATNDGIHPPSTNIGRAHLTKGMHKLVAGVFNAGGGVELAIDIEGQGLKRQPITPLVFLSPEGSPKLTPAQKDEESFPLQAELVEQGRQLFASLGCANCHQLHGEKKSIATEMKAPNLAQLRPSGGCLDQAPKKGLPWFSLNHLQRNALAAALAQPAPPKPAPAEVLTRTLTAFNCYACHQRDKIGGPEEAMNSFFTTTQPEMGDEARLPPHLDGVGAKLTSAYLKRILDKGVHDRLYMNTRMPRFGEANVGHLTNLLAALDTLEPVAKVTFAQSPAKVKAEGRHMVGGGAFGCIKCHTFAGHKAEGVQGIDMTLLTQRLKHDWFVHYLVNPNRFRPGTRMPTAWPNGQSTLPQILDGDAPRQIEAIWLYLADGPRAALPPGLKKQSIPLVPDKEAIIYRNFVEGAGPRAIAVGFPEKAHLAFDANELCLAMIWQGDFLDAARHWSDRGVGFEPPLGDNVLHLGKGVPFAVLATADQAWPAKSARELGHQFRGYRLTADQRPTFLYSCANVKVEDTPNAVNGKPNPVLHRTLVVQGNQDDLWFRAAVADKIESAGAGWYRLNNEWKMRLEAAGTPRLRQQGAKTELLVPVRFQNGSAVIVQEFVW